MANKGSVRDSLLTTNVSCHPRDDEESASWEGRSSLSQLMVMMVWHSNRGTPFSNNPCHKGNPKYPNHRVPNRQFTIGPYYMVVCFIGILSMAEYNPYRTGVIKISFFSLN